MSHFTDEDTEARGGNSLAHGDAACKWRRWDPSQSHAPESSTHRLTLAGSPGRLGREEWEGAWLGVEPFWVGAPGCRGQGAAGSSRARPATACSHMAPALRVVLHFIF